VGPIEVVLTYDDCVMRADGLLAKPLAKLEAHVPGAHPQHTFIVDDRETAFDQDDPHSGVLVPAYEPTLAQLLDPSDAVHADTALLRLMRYFDLPHVRAAADVRAIQSLGGLVLSPRAVVLHPPTDLFIAMCVAIYAQPIVLTAAERIIDQAYRTHSVVPPQGLPLLCSRTLRDLVVFATLDYAEYQETLRLHAIILGTAGWSAPARRVGDTLNVAAALRLLADPRLYRGDMYALEVLSDQLEVCVCVVNTGWRLAARLPGAQEPLGRICLRLVDGGVQAVQ
jgi:hypothetical protein